MNILINFYKFPIWLMAAARGGFVAAFYVAIAVSVVFAERAAFGADATPRLFTPWMTLTAARLAPADGTGMPALQMAPAPLTRLMHPARVAVLGNNVYIVDTGARRVFRFDLALNAMAALSGVTAALDTQVRLAPDATLFVLDPSGRRVVQVASNGRPITTFSDPANLARPVAVAFDGVQGVVLVADAMFNQFVAFNPLGRAARVIGLRGDERNRVMSIAGIAVGREAIFVSDSGCRCVARVARDGAVLATFGHGEIGQPGTIAVDRHERVFVADVFNNSIKVFVQGRLVHDAPAGELGVLQVSDLSLDDRTLAIADGAGARVVLLRIAPPPRE